MENETIKTGTLKFDEKKGYFITYDPKTIYGYYGVEEIKKIYYSEIIVDPFNEKKYQPINEKVNFRINHYVDNEGSFFYAEIVEC